MGNDMKPISQLETLKSLRRMAPPQFKHRVERPKKGAGYRRPQNKKWDNE